MSDIPEVILRRALVITGTFYPDPSVGAIRVSQWCKYLPDHAWAPIVVCRNKGFQADPGNVAKVIHPFVKIHYLNDNHVSEQSKTRYLRQSNNFNRSIARRVARDLVRMVCVPGRDIGRWRKARKRAIDIAEAYNPKVIISTSPSHSVHDLGMWLSKQMGLPWVADFRDPYIIDPRYVPRGTPKQLILRHRAYEEKIYRSATVITHAIPFHSRWARYSYPWARNKIVTIPNGVPDDAADILRHRVESRRGGRISVVGRIDPENAMLLVKAVSDLNSNSEGLELRFVGVKPENAETLEKYSWVRVRGQVTHREALTEIAEADVLVSILDQERALGLGLSSKLYEYLAAGKPIVIVNPTRSDKILLKGLKSVWMIRSTNEAHPGTHKDMADGIAAALETKTGDLDTQANWIIDRYNRKSQVAELAYLLDRIT